MSQDVAIPKWFVSILLVAMTAIFGGMITWLTNMNSAIHHNSVEIAAIKAELTGHSKDSETIRVSIERINDKLDRLIERLVPAGPTN